MGRKPFFQKLDLYEGNISFTLHFQNAQPYLDFNTDVKANRDVNPKIRKAAFNIKENLKCEIN